MGGKNTTTTQKTELPPDIVAAYDKLLAQAQPVSQTPYQPYTGGFTGDEQSGFNSIAALKDSSNAYYQNAANDLAASTNPAYNAVRQYMNPYIGGVVKAATANMQEQNGEQQQGVLGNAAALGALGGNRVGVAQSELARQQDLANNANISNILEQGYGQALGAAQAQQGYEQNAAAGLTDIGKTQMQTNLAQAAAQVGAGTQQQQWNYQQYQNSLAYPFETTSWLANIVEGLGAGRGTTTTTQPSGNSGSAVLGGVLSLASLLNRGGAVHDRPRRAMGGVIPYTPTSEPSGIISPVAAANNNNPPAVNDNGYVPQAATGTAGIGPAHPGSVPQPQDQGSAMLQQGLKAEEGSLAKRYPNGILAGVPAPMQGPTLSGAPLGATQQPGLLSRLGGFLGFADGGVTRKGYDIGGGVDYPNPIDDPSGMSVADLMLMLGQRSPAPAPVVPPVSVGGGNVPVTSAGINQAIVQNGGQQNQRPYVDPTVSAPNYVPPAKTGVVPPQNVGTGAIPPPDANMDENGYWTDSKGVRRDVNGDAVGAQGERVKEPAPASGVTPYVDPKIPPGAYSGAPIQGPSLPNSDPSFGDNPNEPIFRDPPGKGVLPLDAPQTIGPNPVPPNAGVLPVQQPDGSRILPDGSTAAPITPGLPFPPRPGQQAQAPQYTVGNAPQMAARFSQIEQKYGLPAGYLNHTAMIESQFNPNADNGIAQGEFQFTRGTAAQYGLKNPFDPIASADAAARLAVDNQNYLRNALGREPTAGELYLAHQQGASGALNLITHPNAPAADIVGRMHVIQNIPKGTDPNLTAGQFASLWTGKFGGQTGDSGTAVAGNGPQEATDGAPASGGASGAAAGPSPSAPSTGGAVASSGDGAVPSAGVGPGQVTGGGPTPHTGVLGGVGAGGSHGLLSMMGGGHGLPISDDQRMALLAAGLGMMAGTSPHASQNIGAGGLRGLEQWKTNQELNRQNAETASEINYRQGDLANTGQRLAIEAQRAAGEIKLETAQAGQADVEAASKHWIRTMTPNGLIIQDATNPNAPPRIISLQQLSQMAQNGTLPPEAQGPINGGGGATGGSGGTGAGTPAKGSAAPAAVPVAPSAASGTPGNAPVTAAPTQPVGIFQTHAPKNIQLDPRGWSLNPDVQSQYAQLGTKAQEAAQGEATNAAAANLQMEEMKEDLKTINPDDKNSGWLSQGAGFPERVAFAKKVNTYAQMAGIASPYDEKKVAAGEDLNKLTTRAGFDFTRTLGTREAASIVEQGVAAVPSGANSPEGARRIIAAIEATNQRKMDYSTFLTDWAAHNSGSTYGAAEYFNRVNPPELYALSTYVPPEAMQNLRDHPDTAKAFDAYYGHGRKVSQYVLAGKDG